MARVWCFVLGCAACCLMDLDLSCPKTDRFWGLFYLSPTLQCQKDPKLVQILKSMNCEVCILTTQRGMKTWLWPVFYPSMPSISNWRPVWIKIFCTGEIWKLINLCCLSKLKSWIKSYESLQKEKRKPDGSFLGLLRRKHRSAKDLFKNTWSFCGLSDTQTKYSICKCHAVTI